MHSVFSLRTGQECGLKPLGGHRRARPPSTCATAIDARDEAAEAAAATRSAPQARCACAGARRRRVDARALRLDSPPVPPALLALAPPALAPPALRAPHVPRKLREQGSTHARRLSQGASLTCACVQHAQPRVDRWRGFNPRRRVRVSALIVASLVARANREGRLEGHQVLLQQPGISLPGSRPSVGRRGRAASRPGRRGA
ncbi:hypothetical protein OAO87_03115, partial [bacterium]|nr:hypothetical protein [bacterium]